MTEENALDSGTEVTHVDETKTLGALTEETARGQELAENIVKETCKVDLENMGKANRGLNEINLNQNEFPSLNLYPVFTLNIMD